jgi:hypothetical protein
MEMLLFAMMVSVCVVEFLDRVLERFSGGPWSKDRYEPGFDRAS